MEIMGVANKNLTINDIKKYQKNRLRGKEKSLRETCKRCKGLMYQNDYSDIPKICKRCGEHIYE